MAHCWPSPAIFRPARSSLRRCCSAARCSRSKASSAPGRRSPPRAPPLNRLSRAFESVGEQRLYTALPAPKGLIEVEEVGLRGREGKPILIGISFKAEPGKILGIIGPSGSGKTTLGKIIVGALAPTVGAVRIDGARMTDWDQDELGRYIGYMPQESSLFEGTIKENISRFDAAPATTRTQSDRQGRGRRGEGSRGP